ncbi:glycoside hydrolase family 3 C-terminal domain-containing protein [Georgenia halophila]|uniref:Glycoside hydrolase family 3 C-terminal domain-containing protein n=1 Tax=Georgenia halophila TaxID=620889 RepID=A0ABP8KUJ5_9MICO
MTDLDAAPPPGNAATSDGRPPSPDGTRLNELLRRLTLDEKVALLTGRDFWTTLPIEKIGLRPILVSDGPSGVRGERWDEREPSLNLPSASALSSSWDLDIARRYGACAAVEARRKGVDVVLGPTINLHRSPLGGRHFEAFSEDPLLTAELAAAYVRGVQDNGVGATPKHYVANDFETDRFTADVVVSERALRELYLLAFEKSVTEAGAWLVMSAYNAVNGAPATENDLLETPLNSEWGFDGVVISDWTAVRSLESASYSQDLVMPGPEGPWGDALIEAVRAGAIDEAVVDRKVRRILLLAARVGALEGFTPAAAVNADAGRHGDGRDFARTAATEGTVLLRNQGELPWHSRDIRRIAVIGHNAKQARTQGGGSATVVPESVVSPLDGIREAFPDAEVTYSLGAIVQDGVGEFAPRSMINPVTEGPGAHVRFLDADGKEIFTEERFASALVYFGGDAPVARTSTFEFSTRWTPEETGTVRLGLASVGHGRVYVDGDLVLDEEAAPSGDDLGAAFLSPRTIAAEIDVEAGVTREVRVELHRRVQGRLGNGMSITIGTEPPDTDPEQLTEAAAAAARAADVAVVVVGTNPKVESEGFDRTDLALPGRQDDLVRAVAAANPRTVAVVNAGSPVLLPWRDEVAAIVLPYFPGQEFGHALADVLSGAAEPGGRLPTTWPVSQEDVPVIDVTPVDGRVRYDEGIHIGYRAWMRARTSPAYPFGHGMGYTTWELGEPTVTGFQDGEARLRVPLTNTGTRAGKQVVQVYAERADSSVERPVRWLVAFQPVRAGAGESLTCEIAVDRRSLAHWAQGWNYEPGAFTLRVGTSVDRLPHTVTVVV